ncbi:MAG: TonB family protein [Candidatus Omnitrophica bacterium]|nr:TonB family protein [Candidatus Omnitrophota bacterium]
MKLKSLILTVCLGVLLINSAQAWEQEVQLVTNELKVFSVYKLQKVAIGDPLIADVVILSDREIMVLAKKEGVTSLLIWDDSGQRAFSIIVLPKDLNRIAERIRGLFTSSDVRGIRVKTEGDKIYIIGEVLHEFELDKVKDAIAPFKNVVNLVKIKERQPLVEIDINVLEVAYDDQKTLGLDWSNSLPITYTEPSGAQPQEIEPDIKRQTTGKFPKLWRIFKWDRTTVTARLNFLIENDKARTLANPKLVTLSGKEASFLVGGEVAYLTVETEGRTKVEWKEYGVDLKIKPLVNSKNEIKTEIKAEVVDLDWANAVTLSGYNIPAFKKREVRTELFLNDGDTIFLAGLIKNQDSENVDRLPWLSSVPILGELFKSTQFKNERTELVISITPTIVGEKAHPEYLASELLKQQSILQAQRNFPAYSEEHSPLAYYADMIEDIITRNIVYPGEAKEEQQEGIVKIDLFLLSDGKIKKAEIKESSGVSALDKAALTAVEELAPYPSFPSQITQKELRLTVPVVFKSYVKDE